MGGRCQKDFKHSVRSSGPPRATAGPRLSLNFSTAQFSTAQFSTAQFSTAQFSTAQFSTAQR
jgi:uncharacterized protein YjbI with pentapeptide repeats